MNKGRVFFDIDSPPESQRISSARFDEFLLPTQHNAGNQKQQQLDEALKEKRNIFERSNFRAMNQGHKVESSDEEQCISLSMENQQKMDSLKSRTNSLELKKSQDFNSPSILFIDQNCQGIKNKQSNLLFDSTSQIKGKSYSKLDQYQSFVNQIEKQEKEIQKNTELIEQSQAQQDINKKKFRKRREDKVGLNEVWQNKGLIIIRLVSKFIQQLKTKTETIKFRLLTQRIFSVIGDISSNFEYILVSKQIKQKPSWLQIIKFKFQKKAKKVITLSDLFAEFISQNIKVIKPDSKFKIIWDICLLVFIIMNIFYIPINISFDISTSGVSEYLFDQLPTWIFVAEIVVNFNTAYYDKGLMHEDRKSIIKHYIKGNFFWDLLVVIPSFLSGFNIPYVRYTLLLRLTRLSPLMESIEEVLNLEENIQVIVDLCKLVFFLVLTGHFCGCAWHFVAITEYQDPDYTNNWLTSYEPQAFNYHWFDRYIISLYWSVITTVTVGYGDIIPVTTLERIFVIIVTLLLCGVFGYCISNIGNIFKQISDKKTIYKQKIKQIHQHIRKRGLNINLSLKVKKYFEYYYMVEQEEETHNNEFLQQLTRHLREEVMTDFYCAILKKSRFIRENFCDETIANLCQFVKEKKILPEEVLFSRFEQPTKIWFVISGALEYIADHNNETDLYDVNKTLLKKVTSGAVLGEKEFITQKQYEFKSRAIKFTQLAYINYNDFINVIAEKPDEYEKFCMKRDRLLFHSEFKGSGNICEICEWTHNFIQCPFVFLQPNFNKIANRFTSVKLNKRIKFPFRSQLKTNSKLILRNAQETALSLIVENQLLSEQEFTDDYLLSLGFLLVHDDETPNKVSSPIDSSQIDKSPSSSEVQQKLSLKAIGAITTDLKESHDIDVQSQAKKTGINFKRIKFSKDITKAVQSIKKDDEQSLNLNIPQFGINNLTNKKSMFKEIIQPRRSSNFDDFGLPQISQKFQQQDQDLQKFFFQQLSKNSETNEMKESIAQKTDKMEQSNYEIDPRKKARKTIVQVMQRRSYQKQGTNISPTNQLNIIQNQDGANQRQSYLEHYQTLGRTSNQLMNSGLIEKIGELGETYQNQLNDSLQQKILDIVHQNESFNIDFCKSYNIYFVEYNVEQIIKNIEDYYSKIKKEQKVWKKMKSNRNLFDRIRPIKNITLKTNSNNKSLGEMIKEEEIL